MKKLLFLLALIPTLVFAGYHRGDKVVLLGIPGCGACAEAKQDLESHNIPFTYTISNKGGMYPQLYVNGSYKGTGVGAVESWINS